MNQEKSIASAIAAFEQKRHEFQIFMDGVGQWFSTHPKLSQTDFPIVHSVKARLKNCEHLKGKILRQWNEDHAIVGDNGAGL
jgi:ppGpp synthetase/RelA/SpoT-type nucleotidyltranferase